MKKHAFGLLIVAFILLAMMPLSVLAQDDEALVCDAFPNSGADVRTSYYMGEGAGFFEAGQLVHAIDSFSCVIEQIDPGYVPAYMMRAAVFTARRTYDEALADYTSAIDRAPALAAAFNNRGIVYAARQEYDLALADFDQVLSLQANDVIAYSNRGIIRAIVGDFEQAIADLEQAIALSDIEAVIAEITDPDRPADTPWPSYSREDTQAYAVLGIIYSGYALDNYNKYLLLTGSLGDERIQSAAGALQSRFTFDLSLQDGTWLLTAAFTPGDE